jgi:hypothetical protein
MQPPDDNVGGFGEAAACLAAASAPKDNRPTFRYVGGELHNLVEKAQVMLRQSSIAGIFQRGGQLVRIVRVEDPTPRRGITRRPGALAIVPVDAEHLVVRLTEVINWQKFDGRSEKWKDIDAPRAVAAGVLAMAGAWSFPTLSAIIEAPTLRPDGTVLDTPGHDAATGLFFDAGGAKFQPVPDSPTRDDAVAAVEVFAALLKGFPFIDDDTSTRPHLRTVSFSVALAAILTALVRRSVRTAPLFGFSAPTMGSGKSLLADVVSMIATGRPAAAMSYADDPAEDRKRLLAALMAGDPIVTLDNIEAPLGSDALCSILTQESYRDRVLGVSQNVTVPTCATFLATGNNLVIKGDLSTRALMCRLDSRCEHPEERQFDVDLYLEVPRRRAELVKAALTILRAHTVAGRAKQPIAPYGRFDEWSDLVRSALVWCGLEDPCVSRSTIEDAEPDRTLLGELLAAWEAVFGSAATEVADVVRTAQSGQGEDVDQLSKVLMNWQTRGEVSSRKLGGFIAKKEKRVHDGLRFEKVSRKGRSATVWAVVRVNP